MRSYHLRFDIWICLLIAFVISYIPAYFVEQIYENKYSDYVKEHTASSGDIGSKADDNVFRANSVEDLLKNEKFTIVSEGIKYRNEGAGYFEGKYMYAVRLKSGEKVAALINMESVTTTGDSIYSGDSILPVGRVVYKDLSSDESFLSQIEYREKLSRKDFYIDMAGISLKVSQDDYVEVPKGIVQFITLVVCFAIFHMLGSKLGIFPYFFAPKKKIESEWD